VRTNAGPLPVLRGALLHGALAALVGGCAQNTAVTLTPPQRLELETRALDLLQRAARSDVDVVCCNALEALVRVAPRSSLPAFRSATQSASPLVRYAGFAALGEVRDRDSLAAMTSGVNDVMPRVRLAAAFAAARCGKPGYVRVLVHGLTDTPDENLRADAAYLLGRLDEPRAVKALRAALHLPANEKSKRATLHINWALAMLGQGDAASELVRYAQGDAATRVDALLILAELGRPDTRDALLYRLGAGEDYVETRLIVARGLGKIGRRDGYELACGMLSYADPKPDPDDPDRAMRVRSLAAHALGEIGDPQALPLLRDMAATETDERLQVAACYAICRILKH